jgi:2-aminoethylphosphonate-pyruvate transaminase
MHENVPDRPALPTSRDGLLFTPVPLTTSLTVKQAMLRDAGSWHSEFNAVVRRVREELLRLAGLRPGGGYDTVLMQGSGTFGVESVIASVIPPRGKLLVLSNGAYGERIVKMTGCLKIDHRVLRGAEDAVPEPGDVDAILAEDPAITHVALVHCETTTGILNPLDPIGQVVRRRGKSFIVDAMSSFGAIPIDFEAAAIDYLVSSANKCIEGVPGFSFIVARRDVLEATAGFARGLSLDLLGQLRGFEANGQFRFTPPTHAILAFDQALRELDAEGGVEARGRRYAANHRKLLAGMGAMGFIPFLRPEVQSPIITAFHCPGDPAFEFAEFYRRLADRGMIIYPGKLTTAETFRIGTIGRLFEADIAQLLHAIEDVLESMNCTVPLVRRPEPPGPRRVECTDVDG